VLAWDILPQALMGPKREVLKGNMADRNITLLYFGMDQSGKNKGINENVNL
jgi:hypothetical protein